MSSPPTEPEKYSLDDMLERLQGNPAPNADESGELVTRADGTHAIKVRKRKRRSTQPHKEAAKRNTRLRAIQISAAAILLILLVLGMGGLVVYANSSPFRERIVQKISSAAGSKTSLYQFRVNPLASRAAMVEFKWPEGNAIKSLVLGDIQAKGLITGVLSKQWGLDEISVTSGKMHLASPLNGQPLVFGDMSAPSAINFNRFAVSKFDATFGNPSQPVLQILQTEASFYPRNIDGTPELRLFQGNAKIPDWPVFRIDRSTIEFKNGRPEILSLRLLENKDNIGTIELSGALDPANIDKTQSLAVKLESFSLEGLIGPVLSQRISARIDTHDAPGSNLLSFSSSNPSGALAIAFSTSPNSDCKIDGFPFLSLLSQLFENRALVLPVFEDGGTGILYREKGVVTLKNLSLVNKSQMLVTGELVLKPDESLAGTLHVGLPEATLVATLNPKLKALFAENREGFRWVTLKISGTASRPIDNLSSLYESTDASGGDRAPANSFENLTAPIK